MKSDKSNGADRVVKVIRVYESGRVRAARPGASDKPVSGAAWGRPRAHAELAEAAPVERVKNPAKVKAGKARAEKAAAAKLAAAARADLATSRASRKKTKAKTKAKAKPKAAGPFDGLAKPTRGGRRAGSGAKPKAASGDAMVVVAFRVTPKQKSKLARLGNGDFIRDRIDRAPDPRK